MTTQFNDNRFNKDFSKRTKDALNYLVKCYDSNCSIAKDFVRNNIIFQATCKSKKLFLNLTFYPVLEQLKLDSPNFQELTFLKNLHTCALSKIQPFEHHLIKISWEDLLLDLSFIYDSEKIRTENPINDTDLVRIIDRILNRKLELCPIQNNPNHKVSNHHVFHFKAQVIVAEQVDFKRGNCYTI